MIRALTFDLWQTLLYDPHEPRRAALRAQGMAAALAAHGHDITPPRLLDVMAECTRARVALAGSREMGPLEQIRWILGALGLSDAAADAAAPAMFGPYCEASLEILPEVFPAAPATLARLAADYPLAVICNTGTSPGSVLRAMLHRLDLMAHLRALVASDELGYRKPHPLPFQTALGQLGVAPREAVHIGDDPTTDVHGAKLAGMKAILLTGGWHGSRPHRNSGDATALAPDAVVADLADLPKAIARLASLS